MSSGPGPSKDPTDIQNARANMRGQFSSAQIRNPWTFVSMDNPLQTLAPPQIEQAIQRLSRIAGAEGSALQDRDWLSLVDSAVSVGENEDILLENGGKLPMEERGPGGGTTLTMEDVESAEQTRAIEDILDICQAVDDAGVDGAEVLELIAAERGDEAATMLADTEFSEDEIEGVLDDIAEAFSQQLVLTAIAECRDQLSGPTGVETAEAEEVLEELQERFDLGMGALSVEEAAERIEDRVEEAQERAQEAERRAEEQTESEIERIAVNRLSRAFGEEFTSLEDAIRGLRERIERARGRRIRIEAIEARRTPSGTLAVRIQDGEDFFAFEGPARRRVQSELDTTELGTTWTEIGEVTTRGFGEDIDLVEIDLSTGRERLGSIAEAQPLEIEQRELRQAEIEEATATEIADDAISLLREDG